MPQSEHTGVVGFARWSSEGIDVLQDVVCGADDSCAPQGVVGLAVDYARDLDGLAEGVSNVADALRALHPTP